MPARKKTKRRKTTAKTTALRPQPHGGALRNGGTNKGGPGRPPEAFKQLCRELASADSKITHLETILNNPKHPQYMAARRYVTEYGYGKPSQPIDVTGEITIRRADELRRARERDRQRR